MPDCEWAEVQVEQEPSLSNEFGSLKIAKKLHAVICPHIQAVFSWVYPETQRGYNSVTFLWGLFYRKAKSLTKVPGLTFGVEDFPYVLYVLIQPL